MGTRLAAAGLALFLAAYAGVTPLFSLFGTKADVALALAVLLAFSFGSFYECAFLALMGACGLAAGIGFVHALLFFSAVFAMAEGVRRAVPWRPFLAGCALVLFFSFLTYVSSDWASAARLAPQFAREALCNLAAFAALYALMPPRNARHGRY